MQCLKDDFVARHISRFFRGPERVNSKIHPYLYLTTVRDKRKFSVIKHMLRRHDAPAAQDGGKAIYESELLEIQTTYIIYNI